MEQLEKKLQNAASRAIEFNECAVEAGVEDAETLTLALFLEDIKSQSDNQQTVALLASLQKTFSITTGQLLKDDLEDALPGASALINRALGDE